MRVVLISGYELGHQPLGLAGPAGRLLARGHDVATLDLSVETWDEHLVAGADRIAFSVPMHTAMRIARRAIAQLRAVGVTTPIACYGLYAPMAADLAVRILAGETDDALVAWVEGTDDTLAVHLDRGANTPGAPLPARGLVPPLERYAHLLTGGPASVEVPVAYVEASRGCAHRCRHCPVPVVYDGRIRTVDLDAVLADVAQQVEAGARHLTFGDPDFLNGPRHARRVVRAVHHEFPELTFDCTVKVEHVLRHESLWSEFADSGCLFVVSAFESANDAILERLDKGHTVADAARATRLVREHGIEIRPSFVPFTPWTTLADLHDILRFVAREDLIDNVDPVQYTIRLLVPLGSLLLDLDDVRALVGPYDTERCSYPWSSPDPALDALQVELAALVEAETASGTAIDTMYDRITRASGLEPDGSPARVPRDGGPPPRLTEPWFCCAEPTTAQFDAAKFLGATDRPEPPGRSVSDRAGR